MENCASNSRLAVDEDDNGKFRLKRIKRFYWPVIGDEISVKTSIFQIVGPKLNKYEDFQPLEVVGRGSETQLQVGENLKKVT